MRATRPALPAAILAGALVPLLAGLPADAAPTANGRVVYGNGTTTPQSRAYTAGSPGTFAGAAATVAGAIPSFVVDRAAPTRDEHLAGYVTTGGVLYVVRWNGTAWSAEWNVTLGGNGVDGRRFDIAYESVSGDAIVVYSRNVTTTNELAYRVWNGTTWTAATNLDPARIAGTATWIKLLPRPSTDDVALTFCDNGTTTGNNADLSTLIWNGTAWGNEPGAAHSTVMYVTTGQLVQNDLFDMAWTTTTGDLVVVWTQSTPQQYYRIWTRTTGAWGTSTSFGTGRAAPLQMSAASDPNSDDIVVAWNRSASTDVNATVWTGAAWSPLTRVGTTGVNPTATNKKHVTAKWLTTGGVSYAVVAWASGTAGTVGYISATVSGTTVTWGTAASQAFTGTFGAWAWMDSIVDPRSADTLMLTFSDANSDLWARQLILTAGPTLTWTADSSAAMTTALTNATAQGFSFAYDRYVPPAATTTVGDGTNPGTASLCPGGAATMLDSFTLQTSSGTDTVTGVSIALSTGSATGLSLVEITNDAGTAVYGSAANPAADTVAVTLTTNITATATSTQYKVRVTPRAHANMPVPPGGTYTVTGTATAITSTNPKTYADTASATVTIDNASPANPTWGTVTPGNGQIVLSWTNPADADFSQVAVLRNTAAIADTPVDGTTYAQGNPIGTSTVRYVGSLATFTDTGLTNGTAYYYRIFAKDACGNYSSGGAGAGPYTPTLPVLPVTPGTATASATSCSIATVTAPYTGDTNGNSTTTFSRGPSATGPWTAVCAGITGVSPRTCDDGSLSASTTYYYQVTFADADGVGGTNPQVTTPITTPVCTVNNTTIGTVSATAASCTSIRVTATFSGDANRNGTTTIQYGATATPAVWTDACVVSGASPRQCTVNGLAASTLYSFRGLFADVDGLVGTNPTAGIQATTTACGADTVAPTITLLSPSKNAVVAGADTIKVQVWDAGGLAATNPVVGQVDGTGSAGFNLSFSANASYSCGTGCTVYQYALPVQTPGAHYVAVRATDAAGNVAVLTIPFRAVALSTGAGTLLRRTSSSQLCIDCHNLQTHNSQATSTTYGNWANDCATCHTPHATRNIFLVREQIETPNSGTRTVDFRTSNGVAANGHATPQANGNGVNVCEVCHTRTKNSDSTPRARNAAPTDWTKHYTSACTGCHAHTKGFAAGESEGGVLCKGCHKDIWDNMQAAAARTSRHTLAMDTVSDDTVTWGNPLGTNAAAARSCLNMCHHDHPHRITVAPVVTTHEHNVYEDATSNASRAATTLSAATKARTDFDNTAANGGMCVSCHRNPVESATAPALAPHPAVSQAAYAASAHNYTSNAFGTWQFGLHDGSKFDRNCTKCHAGPSEKGPASTALPFQAVHWNDNKSLLAGTTNPGATPAAFVCYNCHGNGTTGSNLSGNDIATQVAKTRNHPASSDTVHDSITEYNASAFGAGLGTGVARHASCLDCHEPHAARAGTKAVGTSVAGPPLEGAWGAQLSSNPAFWTAPAATNFTKKVITAGTDLEATLCFKCHSSYYGTLPAAPSGGAETDTAKEFNPGNVGNWATAGTLNAWSAGETAGGFHPVLATAGSNLGAVRLTNLVTTNFAWSTTARNRMACSDCHGSNSTADPMGPHGSTANYILRGPNTTWNGTITVNGSNPWPAGTFCANCHSNTYVGSRFPDHTNGSHNVACWNCHSAIPHGGPRPGMLIAPAGANANVGGTIAGWDTTAPYWGLTGTQNNKLYIVSYPTNSTTNWGQSDCGCNGTGH